MNNILVAKDKFGQQALDMDTAQPDQLWEYVISEQELSYFFNRV